MSKNIILFILTFISGISFSQEKKFIYDKNGLTPFVVTDVENKTAKEIYQKSINWIKETYKNPNIVIKSEIEDESVRFEGISNNAGIVYDGFGGKGLYSVKYSIKISVKDYKYKFEVIEFELLNCPIKKNGWNPNDKSFFKEDGSPRKPWKDYPKSIETLFDELNDNLKNYIIKDSKKDDW